MSPYRRRNSAAGNRPPPAQSRNPFPRPPPAGYALPLLYHRPRHPPDYAGTRRHNRANARGSVQNPACRSISGGGLGIMAATAGDGCRPLI